MRKWENWNGCINVYSNLNYWDIHSILREKKLNSIQFQYCPNDKTFILLNKHLFSQHEITLRLFGDGEFENLNFFRLLPNLKHLILDDFQIDNLLGIEKLEKLKGFVLGRVKNADLSILKDLGNLESLNLSGGKKIAKTLPKIGRIKNLTISGAFNDLQQFKNFEELENLRLFFSKFQNTEIIKEFNKLKKLEIIQARNLIDIDFIKQLDMLEYLTLDSLPKIINLPEFKNEKLIHLKLCDLKNLTDISSICSLISLEELMLVNMPKVNPEDLIILGKLKNLKKALVGLGGKKKNAKAEEILKNMGIGKFEWDKRENLKKWL